MLLLHYKQTSYIRGLIKSRQQQIESHSRKAAEYLKESKPELAAPEFRAIVALDPNNVDARGNLGVLLFFQGAYEDAIPQPPAGISRVPRSTPSLWFQLYSIAGASPNASLTPELSRMV